MLTCPGVWSRECTWKLPQRYLQLWKKSSKSNLPHRNRYTGAVSVQHSDARSISGRLCGNIRGPRVVRRMCDMWSRTDATRNPRTHLPLSRHRHRFHPALSHRRIWSTPANRNKSTITLIGVPSMCSAQVQMLNIYGLNAQFCRSYHHVVITYFKFKNLLSILI